MRRLLHLSSHNLWLLLGWYWRQIVEARTQITIKKMRTIILALFTSKVNYWPGDASTIVILTWIISRPRFLIGNRRIIPTMYCSVKYFMIRSHRMILRTCDSLPFVLIDSAISISCLFEFCHQQVSFLSG